MSIQTVVQERFDASLSPSMTVVGGDIGSGCGLLSASTAMTFNMRGERQLVTVDMNARSVTIIQFTYDTASSTSLSTCAALRNNVDVPVVDYSTNGGVTWTTLKALKSVVKHVDYELIL